jgi:2-hydroxy-3-keto-5-methylthiopentenyl-1-phosphate phosphatase
VSDEIMIENSVRPGWRELDEAYVDGAVGSRDELTAFLDLLPRERAPLVATAERQDHDESFVACAELARRLGVAIEVVSDGFGFYVAPALERLGVPDIPIATSAMTWDGAGPRLDFPCGHPACFVCGTCKRERVLGYQARGFHVAFVGDGVSDRYAAAHADTVFAKDHLAIVCDREGIPFLPWTTFVDVTTWLTELAVDPARLVPPRSRPYVCGPEVWGPGRHAPAPPALGSVRQGVGLELGEELVVDGEDPVRLRLGRGELLEADPAAPARQEAAHREDPRPLGWRPRR